MAEEQMKQCLEAEPMVDIDIDLEGGDGEGEGDEMYEHFAVTVDKGPRKHLAQPYTDGRRWG